MVKMHENYIIHITDENFYIQPYPNKTEEVLVICRVTNDCKRTIMNLIPETPNKIICQGILGSIRLISGYYLLVVSSKLKVGTLLGNDIYRVENFELISYVKNENKLMENENKSNEMPKRMIHSVLQTVYLYFSYTYDLTHSLQQLKSPGFKNQPLFNRADPKFVWNKFLIETLDSRREFSNYMLPLLHGNLKKIKPKKTKKNKAKEDKKKKEAQLNADFENAKELLGLEQSLSEEEELDDIKDDWDAPDPEPVKEKPKPITKITKAKPKKTIEDMTEEEKKEAQLNADFENAKELLGLEQSLDEISFESKEDYRNYIQRFMLKINMFSKNQYFFDFIDDLGKAMTEKLTGDQCKKLSNTLRIVQDQKIQEEKKNNPKEVKKGKKGAKIKLEKNAVSADYDIFLKDSHGGGGAVDDDGDDFM